jgi:hypothetical protein
MPCCHGAGGLAAQHKFGARSGVAVFFLGSVKLVVGLVLGGTMLEVLKTYPMAVLGDMLIFVGLELATIGAKLVLDRQDSASSATTSRRSGSGTGLENGDRKSKCDIAFIQRYQPNPTQELWLCLLVASVMLQINTGVGFLAGIVCWMIFMLLNRLFGQPLNTVPSACSSSNTSQRTNGMSGFSDAGSEMGRMRPVLEDEERGKFQL